MMHQNRSTLLKNTLRTLFLIPLFLALGFVSTGAASNQGVGSEGPPFHEDIKTFQQNMRAKMKARMKKQQQKKVHDMMSGIPASVLELQSHEPIRMPSVDEAVVLALQAATEAAIPLIDTNFHKNGRIFTVPDDFTTIQEAVNEAKSGDTVVVKPGTYYEQLIMKDGIRLTSDATENGDEMVEVPGARIKLPKRALRTIIDGSKSKPSKHGMIDFDPGVGRTSIIDGFTIQNLPLQNHHIPGHAHGLNIRGASPVVTNCLIQNMGSTGIGSHVVYNDQESRLPDRDFRWANIKHQASAVLYNNIIRNSVGLGIGCNHFSSPFILGNEVFNNSDASLGDSPSPGMGNKHGSFATIIGNIVHDNPGGGIMAKTGARQGKYGIDRRTRPTILKNVLYDNGKKRPGISCQSCGTRETPVVISGNYVYRPTGVGVGLVKKSVGIIEDNMIMHSQEPNISINNSLVLKLNRNKVIGNENSPGITIVNGSTVFEMIGNAVENGEVPGFMVDRKSEVREAGRQ